jgi:hypothetical protein
MSMADATPRAPIGIDTALGATRAYAAGRADRTARGAPVGDWDSAVPPEMSRLDVNGAAREPSQRIAFDPLQIVFAFSVCAAGHRHVTAIS